MRRVVCRPGARDVAVVVLIAAVALLLTGGLWPHPATTALAVNPGDQALDEWFLAHATRVLGGHLELVTPMLNAPDGVNLMANASLLGLGVLFAPVTLAFGAPVSFALIVTGNLAATGAGWYLLFARSLRYHRLGAAVGGMFTAFAPGMVSHANAHLHITAQWLWPVLVWCGLRLARVPSTAGPRWRRVVGYGTLAGVIAWLQVFIGEEVLLLGAIALLVFCLAYAAAAAGRIRPALPSLAAGLAVAAVVGGALSGYPLWVQFAGPQSVPDAVFNPAFFVTDLAAVTARSPLALFPDPGSARLVTHIGEASTFLGWPLPLAVLALAIWLRRRPEILAGALTAGVMLALSLGPHLVIDASRGTQPGPYALLDGVPVLQDALPVRFALAAIVPLGLILAGGLHHALGSARWTRLAVPLAILVAVLPVLPGPLPVRPRPPVPRFFSQGYWRDCVHPGGVLVPVPLADGSDTDPMRWPAATNDQFAIPEGWFIGPYAADGGATIGTAARPTADLLASVGDSGTVPDIGADERGAAQADIAFWHASCVVLVDTAPHQPAVKSTLDQLFGPGTRVADVWTWRPGTP